MAVQQTSFTLTQLIDRTKGDLGLRGSNLITDGDVTSWSHEAMRMASQQAAWFWISDSVDATINVSDYDLPTNAITLLSLAYNNIPLPLYRLEDMDYADPYWRSASTGTPYLWYRRGFTGYTIYPTPSATLVNGIDRIYTAVPAMPAAVGNTFNFPLSNEQLLVSYCLYRGSLKDATGEGGARVTIYQREWMSELQRLKEAVSDLAGAATVMGGMATGWARSPFDVSHRLVPAPGAGI